MSGQFGSSQSVIEYDGTISTMLAGFAYKASDSFKIGVEAAYNVADAGMDSFRMLEGEAFAATKPNQSYDFSNTYLNSDLDVSRIQVGVNAKYKIKPSVWISGDYTYIDYQDDAPYLYDTTGTVDVYGLSVGFSR